MSFSFVSFGGVFPVRKERIGVDKLINESMYQYLFSEVSEYLS